MDLLKRRLAPITPEAWTQIDSEAARVLRLCLAGRRLVDFDGPHGWDYAAVNTGGLSIRSDGNLGVPWGIRAVLPLIELRVPFELRIMDLDNASRGAVLELGPVVAAAELTARAEDEIVFNGSAAAGFTGILPSASHPSLPIPVDYAAYPAVVVKAVEALRRGGVEGPYALVLDPGRYAGLTEAVDEGHSVRARVEHSLGQAVVPAASVTGGVVLSVRGGDFRLIVGQDLSIGYRGHDQETVFLYLTESFAFRVVDAAAAVRLSPDGTESRGSGERH